MPIRRFGSGFIGNGFPGSTPDKDFKSEGEPLVEFNPDKAQQVLADAGYPDGNDFPVLELKFSNSNPDNTTIFEYLQAIWEDTLGIKSTLVPLEPAAMTSLRDAGEFDITPQGWGADYFDASNMMAIFSPDNLINAGRYENPKFTEAYNGSLAEADNSKRIKLLQEAERIFIGEDMGIIPLYYGTKPYIFRESVVTNVKFDANGSLIITDLIVNK